MARKTKADLEQTIQLQLETIMIQQKRINDLQRQLVQKAETSPVYQRAISDAKLFWELANMYKEMLKQKGIEESAIINI